MSKKAIVTRRVSPQTAKQSITAKNGPKFNHPEPLDGQKHILQPIEHQSQRTDRTRVNLPGIQ